MRIIAECQHCKRRYNATGHDPGTRFHCQCSQIVEVPSPESNRNANVVRCSSCGGARSNKASECQFCSGSFTIHDYDLNTACHKCFTRVSDKAKFCHNCGSDLATEDDIGNITDKVCPACKQNHYLHTRQFQPDHPAVLECSRCVGIWLTHDYFEKVMQEAITTGEIALKPDQVKPNVLEAHSKRNPIEYRKCPDCHQFMARQNFARRSGVIVDSCAPHGKWFDEEELTRILTWVQAGGMLKSAKANLSAEQARLKQAKRRLADAKAHENYSMTRGLEADSALALFSTLFR